MSHQSGITVAQELCDEFGVANRDGNVRFIVCEIKDEKVVKVEAVAAAGDDWQSQLDDVQSHLTADAPRYVLFSKGGRGWILMAHVPDKSKVKDKMLYASTRSTVKRQLGANFFDEEMFGTLPSEFSKEGYAAFQEHVAADVPLTREEFRRQEELESGEIYQGGAGAYVHGVSFAASGGVNEALKALVAGSANYVVLGVDTGAETITLSEKKAGQTIAGMRDNVSLTEPQFHFFRYETGERETVFVYTCPDGSGSTTACPIKMRMLYSSSKARVVQLLEANGGTVAKSFEFNEPSEVDEGDMDNALHPPKAAVKAAFTKPSRPGRGARKLIRK
eukprot:TRINITY_DN2536_c0_g1_i1.p1 TRINITY_DN2536_c0_g1~~TRINITY_DN2536_c0_g1_i1.p1  ORF type:complete len:333 (-),score=146.19 TRINITY_DN2536_c0_g1_i1:34-1032(-)